MVEQTTPHKAQKNSVLQNLLPSIVLNVVCPLVVYRLLEPHFPSSSVMPLALSSLFPLVGVFIGFLRQGILDIISVLSLIEIGINILALQFTRSPVVLLLGQSLDKAVLGIIYLLSLLSPRPFMFYVARQFVAGNDVDHIRRFNNTIRYPYPRSVFRRLTTVWGLVFVAESFLRVVLALTLSVPAYLAVSSITGYGVYIGLTVWSIAYGRRVIPRVRSQMYQTNQTENELRE